MHWTTMPTTLMTPSSSQSFTRLPQPAKGGLTPAFSVETKQQQQSGTCRPQPCCTSSVRKPDNKTAQPRGGLRCLVCSNHQLVINYSGTADASLAAYSQRIKSGTFFVSPCGFVSDGEEPDGQERQRDGEHARVREWSNRLGKAKHINPYGFAQDYPYGSDGQAGKAADNRTTGSTATPGDGQYQNREVGTGSDGEGQTDHEGHVLMLEDNAQQDRQHTQHQDRELRDTHLLPLGGTALGNHAGVQVMGDGRRPSQGQTGNYRNDGGKGYCSQKAQQQAATHGVGQVHRSHVGTANQRVQHVKGAIQVGVEELRVAHQQGN